MVGRRKEKKENKNRMDCSNINIECNALKHFVKPNTVRVVAITDSPQLAGVRQESSTSSVG